MGENTHQNCTRQNKNKEDPGRQQPCWGLLFCTNLTQPTGNLDTENTKVITELFQKLNKEYKTTFIIVTHEENLIEHCEQIIRLRDGEIVIE